MQQEIFNAIKAALQDLGVEDTNFVVERPSDFSHGDYATNVALIASKQLGKSPKEVAESLKEKLEGKINGVEKIEIAGPGFLNFFLSVEKIKEVVVEAAQDDSWGRNDLQKNKTIMVEYTDPNPFKEFHIGHLMSNTIGEAIARTLENAGATVIRANYQGDVGPHVAKAIFGLLKTQIENPTVAQLGEAYVLGATRYEESVEDKAKIDDINKAVYEKSDAQINALYEKGRAISFEHFEELYKLLGTKFDRYFFESESGPKGLELVHKHVDNGVFEKSDGAIVFRGEKVGLHTRVFINSLGLPTYEAKEVGLFELKKEKETDVDESITITASEQNEYFKVVLAAAKEIPEIQEIANKTKHVSHGMMRFASGKMSSRKGNVITGESLLMDLKAEAKKKMGERELQDANKIAEEVAVGAIKYAVLRQGSGKDIVFDPEQSLSLEGDSGPYLQYARVRAKSVLKKIPPEAVVPHGGETGHWMNLARILVHYPDVVARAAQEMEPHLITTYLTELAAAFNSLYGVEQFIIEGKMSSVHFTLLQAFDRTMSSGLHILAIPAPEEM